MDLITKIKASWKVLILVFCLAGAAGVANWLGFNEIGSFLTEKVPAADVQ